MNVLIIMELSNSKCRDKLKPLSMVDEITNIVVLRRIQGPILKKVKYITPPRFFQVSSIFLYIWKIFQGFKMIKKEKIDLILSFYFFPHNVIAVSLGLLFNKPTISSLIGTDTNIWFEKSLFKLIFSPILQRNIQIFVTGNTSKQKILNQMRGFDKKIKILPNSIDIEKFVYEKDQRTIDFIFIGSLISIKRVDIIIEILNEVSNKINEVKLVIAGSGPEEVNLKDKVRNLNLKSKIEFIGKTSKINYWLNKSKILLLTSKSEGRPAVIMEAMSCGTVPVVLNVGDIKDMCQSGVDSILINNSADFKVQFVKQLILLLKDDDYWIYLSNNAKKRRKDFSYSNTSLVWKETIQRIKEWNP